MNNPKTEEIVKIARGCAANDMMACYICEYGKYSPCNAALLAAAADLIEQLQQKLIDERYRHDRLQDFCVAQGEELSRLKARQRWIPVTEPPKEDGKYLVYRKFFGSSSIEAICFAHHGNDVDDYDLHDMKNVWYDFDAECGFVPCHGVTHWQSLPEPPKE